MGKTTTQKIKESVLHVLLQHPGVLLGRRRRITQPIKIRDRLVFGMTVVECPGAEEGGKGNEGWSLGGERGKGKGSEVGESVMMMGMMCGGVFCGEGGEE